MKHKLIIGISVLCLGLVGNVQAQNKKMYRKGWIDFNKNGVKIFTKTLPNLLKSGWPTCSPKCLWRRKPASWQPFTATGAY